MSLEALLSRWRMAALVCALFCLLPGTFAPAIARDLTQDERAALAETVAAFEAAMRGGDFEHVIDAIPPRMLEQMAEDAGAPVGEMREAAVKLLADTMASVTFEFWEFGQAEYRELADGTPYTLMPTLMVLNKPGEGRFAISTHTLGLLDGGRWYLLRVGEAAQDPTLNEAYPDFAGVEFPLRTVEVLER